MAFNAFRGMKPFPQFMFSIFIILVCFLGFMILSMLMAIPFWGMEAILNLGNLSDLPDPEAVKILKFFQVVQAIGLFIIPPLVLAWLYSGQVGEYLYLKKSFSFPSLMLVFLLMFFASPFINFVGELNANMVFPEWMSGIERWMQNAEENAERITRAFLNVNTMGGLMFNLFMIAFLPAIGEELLFRGVIQKIFVNWTRSNSWGIWIAAILFSGLHMQFYGFVPRLLLGVLFGYLLVWSGSMWLPIIAHFLNNAIAVIAIFLVDNKLVSLNVEEIGSTTDSYYMAAISLVLISIFMLMLKKQNESNHIQPEASV